MFIGLQGVIEHTHSFMCWFRRVPLHNSFAFLFLFEQMEEAREVLPLFFSRERPPFFN